MALRKQYIIFPKFQLVLIAVNSIVYLTILLFIGLQSYLAFQSLKHMGVAAQLDSTHPYYRFLDLQASTVYSHLTLAFLVGFLVSTLVTIYYSHKLAGPLVRLNKFFSDIRSLDVRTQDPNSVRPLNFRKGDYLADLAPVINEALSHLSEGRFFQNETQTSGKKE